MMSTQEQTAWIRAHSLMKAKQIAITETEELGIDENPLFPNGGWDVHHHIFEPQRFKYAPSRHLTPPVASIRQFLDFKDRLGFTHSVLTHGLSYGDDCSSLKAFIPELDRYRTYGVGVIDPLTITPAELHSMHSSGIRGIRVNLYKYDAMDDIELQKLALRDHAAVLANHCPGWSMTFTHTHPEFWGELSPVVHSIAASGIPLVTDHFALLKAKSMLQGDYRSDITTQPGFNDIIALVRSGSLYVKLSAPYRISESTPKYEDIRPIVEALVRANPRQILWGSDWPHTPRMKVRCPEDALKETPFLQINDEIWLRSLKSWLSAEQWDLIMLRNPSALYGNE